MSTAALYSLLSVVGISLLSLVGITLLLTGERFTKKIMIYLVSFSTGALFGDVFLHILPEISEGQGLLLWQSGLILAGILSSFCIEKFIHWNHCHHMPSEDHYHPVGTMTLIADGLHNMVDGVLIAGSFLVDIRLGVATTVAVALHELPQEIGDYALLIYSGYTRKKALFLNFLSGLTAVLGAILTLFAAGALENFVGIVLPLAAGNLLYIAGSDLIPELHKHTKMRQGVLQLAGIVLGVVMMYAILLVE